MPVLGNPTRGVKRESGGITVHVAPNRLLFWGGVKWRNGGFQVRHWVCFETDGQFRRLRGSVGESSAAPS